MRILIAVDFGLFGKAQTQFLYDFAAPAGSAILILHIIEPLMVVSSDYPSPFIPTISPDILQARREAAEQLVSDVRERLCERYPADSISTAVREGQTSEEIISIAEEWKADLILVGSHGHTGIQRFLLGSVSAKVAQHAQCNVMIARSSQPHENPLT